MSTAWAVALGVVLGLSGGGAVSLASSYLVFRKKD